METENYKIVPWFLPSGSLVLCKVLDSVSRQMVDHLGVSLSGVKAVLSRGTCPHMKWWESPFCLWTHILTSCLFAFIVLSWDWVNHRTCYIHSGHSTATMAWSCWKLQLYSKESHATFELTTLSVIYLSSHLCILWIAWLVSTTAQASTHPHVQSVMCIVVSAC